MLSQSQKEVLSLIRQNLASSKTGLIHKASANALIKRGFIKMSGNGIDYEFTSNGKQFIHGK